MGQMSHRRGDQLSFCLFPDGTCLHLGYPELLAHFHGTKNEKDDVNELRSGTWGPKEGDAEWFQ